MSDGENTKTTVTGTVEEVLPNSLFRVRLFVVADTSSEALSADKTGLAKEDVTEGELVLAYLAGKMRLHRIRVLMGDEVEMLLDPYGGRARIVRRLT